MSIKYSIVIPVMNEELNIKKLTEEIKKSLQNNFKFAEIIYVDDGSKDNTWNKIVQLSKTYKSVRGIKLSKNFGHQNSLLAGYRHAKGDAIVSMDGDLQHPPELINQMILKWQEGYQIVKTRRIDGQINTRFKSLTSKLFYYFFQYISGIKLIEGSSDFRLFDKKILPFVTEQNVSVDLFFRGIFDKIGFESCVLPYNLGKRHGGETKYNLKKMIKFAAGSVISFSSKPLTIGIWIGLLGLIFSLIELLYVLGIFLYGDAVPGWTSVIAFNSIMFSLLFILLGIIGIYLSRIHFSLQKIPPYIIDEKANFS